MVIFYFFLLILDWVRCGHEVLYQFPTEKIRITGEEIAIIQFDSRSLSNYWNITARWNRDYADRYQHHYYYLTQFMESECRNGEISLGLPWCKVKAMYLADQSLPNDINYIIYLDSDALVTTNYSMNIVLSYISNALSWDWNHKPIGFNQDGPGFACKQAIAVGYPICFNSGVIVWKRSIKASEILQYWWNSSRKDRDSTEFPMDWRIKWPWEQAQQYEVYLKYSPSVMVLSFPKLKYLPWTSKKIPKAQYPSDTIEPWCFTHWPGANCFITHFCASGKQKQKMRREYDRSLNPQPIEPLYLEQLMMVT